MKFSLICQHYDKMKSAIVELLGLDVFDPTTMKVESEPVRSTFLLGFSTPTTTVYVSMLNKHFSPVPVLRILSKKLLKVAMKMKFGNT